MQPVSMDPPEYANELMSLGEITVYADAQKYYLYFDELDRRTDIPWGMEFQFATGIRTMGDLFRGDSDIDAALAIFECTWTAGKTWLDENTTDGLSPEDRSKLEDELDGTLVQLGMKNKADSLSNDDPVSYTADELIDVMQNIYEYIDTTRPVQDVLIENRNRRLKASNTNDEINRLTHRSNKSF